MDKHKAEIKRINNSCIIDILIDDQKISDVLSINIELLPHQSMVYVQAKKINNLDSNLATFELEEIDGVKQIATQKHEILVDRLLIDI